MPSSFLSARSFPLGSNASPEDLDARFSVAFRANEEKQSQRIPDSQSMSESTRFSDAGGCCGRVRFFARSVLRYQAFDIAMAFVIMVNSVLIGLEQSLMLEGRESRLLATLEKVFLGIYIAELALRLAALGHRWALDWWILFDAVLVAVGLSTAVLEPIKNDIEGGGVINQLFVLRTLRILRMIRAIRLLMTVKDLWMLVHGLLSSGSNMAYTLMMITLMLYIFASLGVELITKHPLAYGPDADDVFEDVVRHYFASVPMTMLTLMQFVTMDGLCDIYRPLIERDNWLAIYFVGLVLVVSIVLMNLVTAVVVNSAIEQCSSDKQATEVMKQFERKRMVRDMKAMFLRLDCDGSGSVTVSEIEGAPEADKQLLCDCLRIDTPEEAFVLLDRDSGGTLEIDEFCEGVVEAITSQTPIQLKRMEKQLEKVQTHLKVEIGNISASIARMAEMMAQGGGGTSRGGTDSTAPYTEHSAEAVDARDASPPKEAAEPDMEPIPISLPGWAHELFTELHGRSGGLPVPLHKLVSGSSPSSLRPCPTGGLVDAPPEKWRPSLPPPPGVPEPSPVPPPCPVWQPPPPVLPQAPADATSPRMSIASVGDDRPTSDSLHRGWNDREVPT